MKERRDNEEPLLALGASRVASARKRSLGAAAFASMRPVEVKIYPDRIEEHQPGLPGRGATRTLRYEQIAQVTIEKGMKWSNIAIESTGGHTIVISHLSRDDAEHARVLIQQRLTPNRGSSLTTSRDLADELARLSDLHDKQLLTDDEFAAAKAKLLRD